MDITDADTGMVFRQKCVCPILGHPDPIIDDVDHDGFFIRGDLYLYITGRQLVVGHLGLDTVKDRIFDNGL